MPAKVLFNKLAIYLLNSTEVKFPFWSGIIVVKIHVALIGTKPYFEINICVLLITIEIESTF